MRRCASADPATGETLLSYDEMHDERLAAEARAEAEIAARREEAAARQEQVAARRAAEARIAELEARLGETGR